MRSIPLLTLFCACFALTAFIHTAPARAAFKNGVSENAVSAKGTNLQTPGWYDGSWKYRQEVSVSNPAGNPALTNYQVKVGLGNSNFNFSKALASGGDLFFTDSDGTTPLNFYLETFRSPDTAVIWLRVPELSPGGSKTIYMYYGNPAASSASSGDNTFEFYDGFESYRTMNAPNYLNTPTYDGSGQTVHPDVWIFDQPWNGYKYWMAITPYKDGNDDYENPSILVSQNGQDWAVPPGLINPLVPMPQAPGYNNDPELVFVRDTLFLYYNESNKDSNTYVKRMFTTDGIHWSTPKAVFSFPWHLMSPAVLFENNKYYMWYVRSIGCYANSSNIYMRVSGDGVNWGPEQPVSMPLSGMVNWHFDVTRDGSKYVMLVSSYSTIKNDCAYTTLYYAESTDKLNWTVNPKPILSPNPGHWDSFNIYRVSFTCENSYLKIWYSARTVGSPRRWNTGYTEGPLSEFLKPNKWDEIQGMLDAVADQARTGSKSIRHTGLTSISPKQTLYNIAGKRGFSVWFYDNMAKTTGLSSMLRVFDSNRNHVTGVGIDVAASADYYAFQNGTAPFTATSVARSQGWHKLEINVKSTQAVALIDGITIGTTLLDYATLQKLYLESAKTGVYYYDDLFIRSLTDNEPTASVVPDIPETVSLELKVLLEGAYQPGIGEMSVSLNSILPTASPYPQAQRTITAIPQDITDWVQVELRQYADSAAVTKESFLLHKDGRIVSDNASSGIIKMNVPAGNYYIVIRHRNHLAIMSSSAVALSYSASSLYDFTAQPANTLGSSAALCSLPDGRYAMIAGDCQGDGYITGSDYNAFSPDYVSAVSGYVNTDVNMDGLVTGTDYNYFSANFTQARHTYVK